MSEPKIPRELLQQAERVFGDHVVALMLDQMAPPEDDEPGA
jgi:hypothetical protein